MLKNAASRAALPVQAEHRETALRWLTGYLARPHPSVGRDGAVCPFVEPAMVLRFARNDLATWTGRTGERAG